MLAGLEQDEAARLNIVTMVMCVTQTGEKYQGAGSSQYWRPSAMASLPV